MVQPHLWACGRRKWQTSLCHSVPIPISSISMSPDATASSQKSQPEALKSWRDLSVGNTQHSSLSLKFWYVLLSDSSPPPKIWMSLQKSSKHDPFSFLQTTNGWNMLKLLATKKPRHQASSWLEEKLLRCFAHCFRGITVEAGSSCLRFSLSKACLPQISRSKMKRECGEQCQPQLLAGAISPSWNIWKSVEKDDTP